MGAVMLSEDEAATLIGVPRRTLRRFMAAGALAYTTVGVDRCITFADLLDFNGRRLAAGQFVAESVANSAANTAALLAAVAPITEAALADLDDP